MKMASNKLRNYTEEQRKQSRERARKWRIDNPERYEKYHNGYYHKNKEEMRTYFKENYQKHKTERKLYDKNYYKTHKEQRKAYRKKWRKEVKDFLISKHGKICVSCGLTPKENYLVFHRKNLIPHDHLTPNQIKKLWKEFIPLCRNCHRTLHHLKKHPKILELLKQRN
jgi:hypothetical protein